MPILAALRALRDAELPALLTMRQQHQKVVKAAKACLTNSGYGELTNVTCEYDKNCRVLILHGRVSSYYLKQRAQEAVRMLDGVDFVDNRIRVT